MSRPPFGERRLKPGVRDHPDVVSRESGEEGYLSSPSVVKRRFRHDEERPNASRTRTRPEHAQSRERRESFSGSHAHGGEDESFLPSGRPLRVAAPSPDHPFYQTDLHVRQDQRDGRPPRATSNTARRGDRSRIEGVSPPSTPEEGASPPQTPGHLRSHGGFEGGFPLHLVSRGSCRRTISRTDDTINKTGRFWDSPNVVFFGGPPDQRLSSTSHRTATMRDQVTGPIMPHGAVVVNACFDHAHAACLDDKSAKHPEYHYVAKHELVFRDKKTNKRKRGAYNEPSLRVFASANGIESAKRDDVSFIGVSNGTLAEGAYAHSAVTIAGLTTIRNTGNRTIEAGDAIVWDVNDAKDNSCRKVFSTVPYHAAFDGGADSHFDAVGAALSGDNPTTKGNAGNCKMMLEGMKDSLKDALKDAFRNRDPDLREFLKCYVLCTRELDSRVIGTAMTKARDGEEFDILLRHSH